MEGCEKYTLHLKGRDGHISRAMVANCSLATGFCTSCLPTESRAAVITAKGQNWFNLIFL